MLLTVHVRPGARRTEVGPVHGGAVRVSVPAPPDRGRANDAVCRLLAEVLGIRRRAVQVAAGTSSRTKTLAIEGLTASDVVDALAASGAG